MTSRSLARSTLLGLLAATTLGLTACSGSDERPLGEAVDIDYSDSGGTETVGSGSVAVTDVEEGSTDELVDAGFSLDPDELAATAVYVHTEFVNDSDVAVTPGRPSGEDGDGNLISPLVIIDLGGAPFEPCPGVPEKIPAGETVEACTIILVPEGVELERISYLPGGGADFVYWKTE